MTKSRKYIQLAFITLSASAVCFNAVAGNGNGNGNSHGAHGNGNGHWKTHPGNASHHGKAHAGQHPSSAVSFTDTDRTNLINYFNLHPVTSKTLPPGIAKNLARGKPLPPGIAKNYLPAGALSVLPNYPGYEYLLAGSDILLVNTTSRIIADILTGALP